MKQITSKEYLELIRREVKDDLKKSPEHLLRDAHEEANYDAIYAIEISQGKMPPRGTEQNAVHSQKRIASLQAVIAIMMERLMIVATVIAIISLILSVIALFK